MWLITTILMAICATVIWKFTPKHYKLDILSLMLWGASLMILVDHIVGYEGGSFVEMETEGLINNGILLGILMVIPVFLIWILILIKQKPKQNLERR